MPAMSAQIIDGRAIAAQMRAELTERVKQFVETHRVRPCLAAVLVGDDPASDAYMTAFAIILLREAGIPKDDARVRQWIDWLKANQRESGRWWMQSLCKDTKHYSTYIATAHALRALALCDELPRVEPEAPMVR
jgi:hypothetical protein